jgi:hypothetical protein
LSRAGRSANISAMFAGHVGAALAIGRAERRVNVGWFIAAALLLDGLLWLLVVLGWESVVIPTDFAATHQPEFTFPYSHGLAASLAWSAVAAAMALLAFRSLHAARWRAATLVAAAVFSHWLLDALVHRPELPLVGMQSAKLGLGLWQSMPIALTVEATLVIAGLWLYLAGSGLARRRAVALCALTLLVLIFTVVGMTIAPAPPSALAMATSSLLTLVVVCAFAGWLVRGSTARETRHPPAARAR